MSFSPSPPAISALRHSERENPLESLLNTDVRIPNFALRDYEIESGRGIRGQRNKNIQITFSLARNARNTGHKCQCPAVATWKLDIDDTIELASAPSCDCPEKLIKRAVN